MTTTFQHWLAQAEITDDPAGDFIADAREDRRLPSTFASADAVEGYLRDRGACQEAIATIPEVWKRYERWKEAER